eukprot:6586074-Pyramimonas_sp.AAC.1
MISPPPPHPPPPPRPPSPPPPLVGCCRYRWALPREMSWHAFRGPRMRIRFPPRFKTYKVRRGPLRLQRAWAVITAISSVFWGRERGIDGEEGLGVVEPQSQTMVRIDSAHA